MLLNLGDMVFQSLFTSLSSHHIGLEEQEKWVQVFTLYYTQ